MKNGVVRNVNIVLNPIPLELKGIPVFTDKFWAVVDYINQVDSCIIKMKFIKVNDKALKFAKIKTKYKLSILRQKVRLNINGKSIDEFNITYDEINHYVTIHTEFIVDSPGQIIEVYVIYMHYQ